MISKTDIDYLASARHSRHLIKSGCSYRSSQLSFKPIEVGLECYP